MFVWIGGSYRWKLGRAFLTHSHLVQPTVIETQDVGQHMFLAVPYSCRPLANGEPSIAFQARKPKSNLFSQS